MTTVRTDAAVLSAHLSRFRRRAVFAIFVRALSMTASAALAGAGIAVLSSSVPDTRALVWAAVAALAAAALATAWRLPSPRVTAAAIDRALSLQDRVVTAVQCAASDDAFSRLVVRDAASRLQSAEPSDVFPLRLPYAAAVAPMAVGLTMLAAAGLPGVGGFAAGRGLASVIPGRSAALAKNAPERRNDANQPTVTTQAPRSDGAQAQRTPEAAAPQSGSSSATERAGADPQPTASGSEAGQASSAAAPTANSSAGDARPDGGGAGAPTASDGGDSRRAGGASGGTATARDTSRDTLPTRDASYAAAYRLGRADAETAIVQDRIPPERRAYVRDYFRAIKPGGQP